MEQIIKSLEKKLNNSCFVYKNSQLQQFTSSCDKLNSLSFVSDNCDMEVSFKYLFSSLPIIELIKILPCPADAGLSGIREGLKYRNIILVNLLINSKTIANWHWCYFPSKELIFSRIHEPAFWSNEMSEDSKVLLCAEIFCEYEDEYWSMENSEIFHRTCEGLKLAGLLIDKGSIIDYCIKKIEYAYPLYYKGFENVLKNAKNALANFSNLRLIGRNGTHSYFDMEECLDDVREKIGTIRI
jgi:protoporphyrinogen oxidase